MPARAPVLSIVESQGGALGEHAIPLWIDVVDRTRRVSSRIERLETAEVHLQFLRVLADGVQSIQHESRFRQTKSWRLRIL